MFDLLLKGARIYDGSGMPRLTDDGCGGAARNRRASQGGQWRSGYRERRRYRRLSRTSIAQHAAATRLIVWLAGWTSR
jgi:hypothetical protein